MISISITLGARDKNVYWSRFKIIRRIFRYKIKKVSFCSAMDPVPRRDFVSFVAKNAREKNLLKKEREDCPTAYSFIFFF